MVSAIVIPVGINYIAGPEGFGAKLRSHAQMQNAFGLTAGTGVTLRGVDVGTVSSSSLDPDGAGARVDLVLRGGTRVPADSFLQITMASMAGIQSVDIIPSSDDGPYLSDGDSIAAPAEKQPLQMDQIIGEAAKVLRDLPRRIGGDHRRRALPGVRFRRRAAGCWWPIRRPWRSWSRPMHRCCGILTEWLDVLDAMGATTGTFELGWPRRRRSPTSSMRTSRRSFYLLDLLARALTHAQQLFDKYRGTFGGVLANLVVVEPIISDRSASLQTGLKAIPRV